MRRAAGYCCIEYQVCASQTNAFSLDGEAAAKGLIDTFCTLDYTAIPGKSLYVVSLSLNVSYVSRDTLFHNFYRDLIRFDLIMIFLSF